MALIDGINALATRIAAQIRDVIMPRVLPSGGTLNQVLRKTAGTNYAVGWVTPFSGSYTDLSDKPTLFSGSYTDLSDKPALGTAAPKNITISTSDPSGGNDGDIWIKVT